MEPVTFTTDDGVRLEGELRMPDGALRGTAAICHPHPRHGGSKDHPLLWALRNELAGHRGLATLSFNFRGVMGSEGTHGGGRDELRDAHAAIGRVHEVDPGLPTVLCGWSFGANVALREALDDDRPAALVLYGIPLNPSDLALPRLPAPSDVHAFRRPVLFVAGDGDPYCPPEELRAYAAGFPQGECAMLEGTDHFLTRRWGEAAALVGDFLDRAVLAR